MNPVKLFNIRDNGFEMLRTVSRASVIRLEADFAESAGLRAGTMYLCLGLGNLVAISELWVGAERGDVKPFRRFLSGGKKTSETISKQSGGDVSRVSVLYRDALLAESVAVGRGSPSHHIAKPFLGEPVADDAFSVVEEHPAIRPPSAEAVVILVAPRFSVLERELTLRVPKEIQDVELARPTGLPTTILLAIAIGAAIFFVTKALVECRVPKPWDEALRKRGEADIKPHSSVGELLAVRERWVA